MMDKGKGHVSKDAVQNKLTAHHVAFADCARDNAHQRQAGGRRVDY